MRRILFTATMRPTALVRSRTGLCTFARAEIGSAHPDVSGFNIVTIVGVAHELQIGYIYEQPVLQFILTACSLADPRFRSSSGSFIGRVPEKAEQSEKHHLTAAGKKPSRSTSSVGCVKDNFVVRCFGSDFSTAVRQLLSEGYVTQVVGQLRLNPQVVDVSGRAFCFPFVHVSPAAGGAVRVLSGSKRKALLDSIHKNVQASFSGNAERPQSSVVVPKKDDSVK